MHSHCIWYRNSCLCHYWSYFRLSPPPTILVVGAYQLCRRVVVWYFFSLLRLRSFAFTYLGNSHVAGICCWIYFSRDAHRQYLSKEKKLREENAANYLGVFDKQPPVDIENIDEDELDLFDAGSCTYIGKASKNDIKVLINRFKLIPGQGPNDIYMLVESLEMIPEDSVSREFITLLKKAFEKRDYLELRWLPPYNRSKDF